MQGTCAVAEGGAPGCRWGLHSRESRCFDVEVSVRREYLYSVPHLLWYCRGRHRVGKACKTRVVPSGTVLGSQLKAHTRKRDQQFSPVSPRTRGGSLSQWWKGGKQGDGGDNSVPERSWLAVGVLESTCWSEEGVGGHTQVIPVVRFEGWCGVLRHV